MSDPQFPGRGGGGFDIYGRILFCTSPHGLRSTWGKHMGKIIASGGHLIILVFLINGRDRQDGPPSFAGAIILGTSRRANLFQSNLLPRISRRHLNVS
ncbi:hypothetical protein BOTBODRAFT_339367 [Botryobasidium botryosum FD-172 SS1]|uniref:Uncharacterized protein n=1 Tax=Botryobasidium botryosum (strain FD-172 SS1) TaxID=930990 RepID=A0A067MG03_BOTB1|nr:hypothetical protein BOTBODRAFT_339367 [Botryobasidium botryosum FD-172 SS1]